MAHCWAGRSIVKGKARGPALLSAGSISFLGDIDIRTGAVVEKSSDLFGKTIAGSILVIRSTKGSAGAWRFIYQLFQHGTHPLAIVTQDLPDPSVVQGAIMCQIPIIYGLASEILSGKLVQGAYLEISNELVTEIGAVSE